MLIEFPRALPVPASTGIFEHIWRGTSAWRSNPAGYSRCVFISTWHRLTGGDTVLAFACRMVGSSWQNLPYSAPS